MSKNKFNRNPVPDSIPEISVPSSVSEFSVPENISEFSVPETNQETNSETETSAIANDLCAEGRVYAEGYKSVRLRKAPNENAEVITTVPVGEVIHIGETVNGWTRVNWSNLFSGWMMTKYVMDRR